MGWSGIGQFESPQESRKRAGDAFWEHVQEWKKKQEEEERKRREARSQGFVQHTQEAIQRFQRTPEEIGQAVTQRQGFQAHVDKYKANLMTQAAEKAKQGIQRFPLQEVGATPEEITKARGGQTVIPGVRPGESLREKQLREAAVVGAKERGEFVTGKPLEVAKFAVTPTSSGQHVSEWLEKRVPVAGKPLAEATSFLTSPLGIVSAGVAPGLTAAGLAGQTAAGTAAIAAGAPKGVVLGAEIAGGLLTPGMATAPGKALLGTYGKALEREGGLAGLGKRLLTEETGGTQFGKQMGTGEEQALAALDKVLSRQPADWEATLQLRKAETAKRFSEAASLRDKYLAEGLPATEAIGKSKAVLRGKMPAAPGGELEFTPQATAWMGDRILTLDYGKQASLATMLDELTIDPTRVIRPFEKRYLEEATGKIFADKFETAIVTRSRAAIGTLPDMSKVPQGVSWKDELPSDAGAKGPTLPGLAAPTSKAAEVLPERKPYLIDIMADSLGLPRALMTAGDISFTGRQAAKTIARHPLITRGAIVAQLKAIKPGTGEAFAIRHMEELANEGVAGNAGWIQRVRTADGALREIPLGQLLKDRYMAVPGTPAFAKSGIMSRPEFYVSRLSSKLLIIAQSGRAYAIGWNTQYQGVTRSLLQRLTKMNGGAISEHQLEAVLNLSERLLGKGELGTSWLAQTLKALGFAPGYRISGPQAFANLLKNPLVRENRQIMRLAAEELSTWTTAGSLMLFALKYGAGATVVTEIASPHFGRIQFPGSKTMYNIWGTDQVLARTIMQAVSKKTVNRLGEVRTLGSGATGPEGYLTAARDAITGYLRSGEDPIIQLITELATGQTYLGEKLKWDVKTVAKLVGERMPMAAQDVVSVAQNDGPIQSIISAPFAAIGVGISSYETGTEKLAVAWDRLNPGRPWTGDSSQWLEAKNNAQLAPLAQQAREEAPTVEKAMKVRTQAEQANDLPMLARGVLRKDAKAGPQFAEAWANYTREMVGANRDAYLDYSPRAARTADGKALDEYYAVRPVRDPVTYEIDWETFNAKRQVTLNKMSPQLQRALKENLVAADPTVQRVEAQYKQAKDLRSQYYNTQRWRGTSLEEQGQIEKIQRLVAQKNRELAAEGRTEVSSQVMYAMVARENGLDARLARRAWQLRPGSELSDSVRNPESLQFLIDNAELLNMFYPDLYNEKLLARLAAAKRFKGT